LSNEKVEYLFINTDDAEIEINLAKQQVIIGSKVMHFEIDQTTKQTLLEGLDEIGMTLQLNDQITEYEKKHSSEIIELQR
jgi:3-isopropylmalate/(R)-2-methylmalate dehydratase small subunit